MSTNGEKASFLQDVASIDNEYLYHSSQTLTLNSLALQANKSHHGKKY